MTIELDWYKRAFNASYSSIYSHRDDASAHQEVSWAIEQMKLEPGSDALDLCCGNGRHTTHLRAQHLDVISLDLSRPLLIQAKARKIPGSFFLCADMRFLPIQSKTLDAVFSFFTSFGYFQSDQENISVIKEISRVLKPGGQLLFDFLNADMVKNSLVPVSEDRRNETTLLQKRSISADGKRVEKEVTFTQPHMPVERYSESVRLFSPEELEAIFKANGLTLCHRFGGFDNDPFSNTSHRLVMHAKKKTFSS